MRCRLLVLHIVCLWLLTLSPGVRAAPAVTADAAILINARTGQVLFEHHADQAMYPASTTKILTAILALELGQPEAVVTTSLNARTTEGTSLYLEVGETAVMDNLLHALLLRSANDAAVAIAEHLAGSVEAFAVLMNAKAAELGATDSHFVNPHGLHDPEHYTTARDLARIAAYAMGDPRFRAIVATRRATMPWPGQEWDRTLDNLNELLVTYPGATGVKTGYTTKAGQCLVASALRDETELIAVVLKAVGSNLWTDATALLDYGFTAFESLPAVQGGEAVSTLKIPFAGSTRLLAATTLPVSQRPGENHSLAREIVITNRRAPLRAGDVVGSLVVTLDGVGVGAVPLVAESAVARPVYTRWWCWLVGLLLAFLGYRVDVARRRMRLARRYARRYGQAGG